MESSRNHPGIVEQQQIVGLQKLGKIHHSTVLHPRPRSMENQQSGVTTGRRPLRDELTRQLEIEIIGTHRRIITRVYGTIGSEGPMDRQQRGRRAEWIAMLMLLLKGYRPRDRNWRGAGGELDIVVERRREIVFVEVKMRSSNLFGGAVGAVDATKKKNLARVSAAYLSRHDLWDRPCRFDVVTVERTKTFPFWNIRHYKNAFSPDLGRRM